MSSFHQHPRDRSRQRSVDPYPETQQIDIDTSGSAAGTKRLFSNRHSRLSYDPNGHNEDDAADPSDPTHSEKRQRSGDWPLPNPSPAISSNSRPGRRGRNGTHSPPSVRQPSSQRRPSRFVEGSMNDRVSQKPPVPYLGTDEELQDQYEKERLEYNRGRKQRPHTYTHHSEVSTSGDTDTTRHSSIFRFGKSIAASFNPSNWKIFSKPLVEEEDEETKQIRILHERQEKAAKIYKELKESGQFRDSSMKHQNFEAYAGKHDSGVALRDDEQSSRMSLDSRESKDEKRMVRVFLEPPSIQGRDESPAPRAGSAVPSTPRSTFRIRRPSMSSIRKAFINDNISTDTLETNEQHMRRIPSRKDLQKQQKLVKRVSDLEGKLEAARRQLNETLNEPLPTQVPVLNVTRKRFVPGRLPTLMSERLLDGYLPSEEEVDSDAGLEMEIGKAVSIDQARHTLPLKHETQPSMAPVWKNKPLPQPGDYQDRLLRSVENEDMDVKEELSEQATTASKMSRTTGSVSKDSIHQGGRGSSEQSNDDGGEIREPNRDTTAPTPTKPEPTSSKDGKSAFMGLADDGGLFEPGSESTSEPESLVRNITQRRTSNLAPKKLHKVSAVANAQKYPPPTNISGAHIPSASTPPKGPPKKALKSSNRTSPSPPPTRQSSRRPNRITKKAASSALISGRRTRLNAVPQSQQQQGRESISPPPSSIFTGVDNKKPASQLVSHISNQVGHQKSQLEVATGDTEQKDIVPPMPKLPRQVRLPSGEVVNVNLNPPSRAAQAAAPKEAGSTTSRASRGSGARLVKSKPKEKEAITTMTGNHKDFENEGKENEHTIAKIEKMPKSQTKASFEWPDDVF